MVAYLLLFVAIVIETVGDIFMTKSEGFRKKRFAFMTIMMYIPTFYILSVVMIEIPVGIAYATWSGIGMILTAIVGVLLFEEHINGKIITSLGVIVIGVLIINLN